MHLAWFPSHAIKQFIDINNTGFSKILKKVRLISPAKFDIFTLTLTSGIRLPRSRIFDISSIRRRLTLHQSRTKELYLSRAVEVQPCFNRDVISDLSDQATTSLQELGAWAEGENTRYESSRLQETSATQSPAIDNNDVEAQVSQIVRTGNADVLKEWLGRMRHSTDMGEKVTRAFLAAVGEAPEQTLTVFIESGMVDIQAEDEINERNCLHEAAISGRQFALQMGVSNNIDVSRTDVYGRAPLHYACMYGHVEMVRTLLRINHQVIDMLDHDNFTPLIHAIVHEQYDCAGQLLDDGARIDPERDSDHVPLDLACQYGATAIAELLLERNAKLLPDAEGLYPQHLVARSGIAPKTLLLLESYGADLDQRDKLYQWSPLLHAASEGHVECLRALLQRGVDIGILDEKGYSAMYYATWEGHLECMELLRGVGRTLTDEPISRLTHAPYSASMQTVTVAPKDTGGIPDLSLPPPIIPLRRYGHNFLDHKTFIQITFHSMESAPLLFYHNSKYPAARLTISSKSSDVIPRNIMLPIQEESRIVSFQIDNLTSFAIDFDIYPTFGSKIIARSVALPSLFTAIAHSSGRCCLPLFDPRLRAIGQISFDFQVIKPFGGISLDITHFATYWRATSQLDVHPTGFITGSSLSGDYVQLFVQLTKDGIPVLYPNWSIDYHGLDQHISRLTYEQCQGLSSRQARSEQLLQALAHQSVADAREIHEALASSFLALKDVLRYLPMSIHTNIHVLFPTPSQEQELGLGPSANINDFADGILKDVFEHARSMKERDSNFMRSIVFSSYNVDICTALNWKQPNCEWSERLVRDTCETDVSFRSCLVMQRSRHRERGYGGWSKCQKRWIEFNVNQRSGARGAEQQLYGSRLQLSNTGEWRMMLSAKTWELLIHGNRTWYPL